jgi:hypothetical protein
MDVDIEKGLTNLAGDLQRLAPELSEEHAREVAKWVTNATTFLANEQTALVLEAFARETLKEGAESDLGVAILARNWAAKMRAAGAGSVIR